MLAHTAHRAYPLPARAWVMMQRWHELLFAHWAVKPDALRGLVPPGLTLDTHDGWAWLGIVPFRVTDVRPRFAPPVAPISNFVQMNVRTYVTQGGKAGVWFFSLEANNPVAVLGASVAFRLPFRNAEMHHRVNGDTVHFESRRTSPTAPPAELRGTYRPTSPAFRAASGSLDSWLTDRLCLFAQGRAGQLYRADIHHLPWMLHRAEAEFPVNTMMAMHNIALNGEPVLHYVPHMDMLGWYVVRV